MPRHSTSRTAGKEAPPETQAQPRANATASQQSVLNLQQGVGNSLTGQIVQRTAPVIRRAGDKLAFERGRRADEGDIDKVSGIERVIEQHRAAKRKKKDDLEDEREVAIAADDKKSQEHKDAMDPNLPKDLAQFLESKNEASTVGKHKKTLATYHERVQNESGWRWESLAAELVDGVPGIELDGKRENGEVVVRDAESQQALYHVFFGKNRFNSAPDRGRREGNVFTKRGYAEGTKSKKFDGDTKSKEFVDDDNGVKTRRYVTRAVTIWHLASMFGLNFKPKKDSDDADVEKAVDETTGKRVDAQLARYNGKEFAGHRDTFRPWESATYLGESGQGGAEFQANYTGRSSTRKPHLDNLYDELKPGSKTGFNFTTGYNYARKRTDEMGLNERASMQVRNGSGPFQPFLSTASIQVDPTGKRKQKIIRANKGERFDTGAENQASVKVDLAEAKKQGIEIVNQHDDESHQHKIAWDRYYSEDDIKDLAARFALVRKYGTGQHAEHVKGIEPTEKELAVFDIQDRVRIKFGLPEKVINRKYIKRSAPDELDEYIYSARKNREVLMKKIPLSCVTAINLNKDEGKWAGLKLDRGVWHEFTPQLQNQLKVFLRGSDKEEDEHYENIQAMYTKASEDKRKEGGNRT